jgi:DNA-binding transcriptional ArsR family regulator
MLDSFRAMASGSQIVALFDQGADPDEAVLDRVFFALSDPVRRAILERLDGEALLVSELAAPFNISLQAVSRHIQVLVRAGLVQQHRTGRISRCSLLAGPIFAVAVWINRYSKYWQEQFDLLAAMLEEEVSEPRRRKPRAGRRKSKIGRKV